MIAARHPRTTVEEYLAMERASEIRHEYFDGEIYAMAGARRNHILITGNLATTLNVQLRGKSCEVYLTDMRVRVSPKHYAYPDVVVVCDKPEFADGEMDILLNPRLIIEVLSTSTEKYDRGKKFAAYRDLEALQEYVLVSQYDPHIEHYVRQGEKWVLSDTIGLESVVELPSIGCTLKLADVYAKVEFVPEEDE
jgi:Uma2 family endonuclease